jgi:hypothetical protein
MRRAPIRSVVAAATLALALSGVAYAAAPTVVRIGNLVLTVNGGVTPKSLPRDRRAPIGFHAVGGLETIDGAHPPAIRELDFDIDRDVEIDTSQFEVCRRGQLEARTAGAARRACPGAVLGTGNATVEVAFPEQTPFRSTGPLTLFNGGSAGGVTTLYLHAYVAVPAPTAVVVAEQVTRESKGPYGLHIVARIPPIAGGSGSPIGFEFGTDRSISYRGERRSFLFARCADGKLVARGAVKFSDGARLSAAIVRACSAED